MKRRSSVLLSVLIVSLLAGIAGCQQSGPAAIRLPMGYVASVQFSPFYMAKSNGYFEDAGYDVTFDYRWETDGIQLVAAGEIPFTVASGDQVIQARAKGLPVVAVAAWWHKFPVAVVSLPGTPLDTPADLKGLTIGIPETFGASYIGLRALLAEAGLTEDDIDLQVIGFTQLAALTNGTVDAAVSYANNEPVVLAQEGIEPNVLYVSDYVDIVANALVTNETMIEEHPDQVRAFVRAFTYGVTDVLADPDAAFELSYAYVDGLEANADAQRAVLEASLDFWRADVPGQFSAESWERAQQVMLDAGLVQNETDITTMYTNAFLP